jgi:hypothetical protein
MRIATYNVENLFSRVRAMNSDDPDKTTAVLADVAELQRLIAQTLYSEADKKRMVEIIKKHKATGRPGHSFFRKRDGGSTGTTRLWRKVAKIGSGRSSGAAI